MNGWWKFHRQMFENPVVNKDSEHFYVWCWILSSAEFEERRVLFAGKERVIEKGQFITTSRRISEELKINKNKVDRILNNLKNAKQIDKQGSNQNTLITVVNWEKYQSDDKQNDKRVINERETDDKPSYYIKNKRMEEKEEDKKEVNPDLIIIDAETVNHSDIQSVLRTWNELERYGIKSVTKLRNGTDRHDRLSARIKEYGIDNVLTAIDNIKQSDFLQGKNNRGWAITFDWFVRPNNFPKVLDGNYTNKGDDKNGLITKNDAKNIRDPYAEELERLLNE